MARDTASDWERIGATEPWYGVILAPEFLSANLTEQAKDRFYDSGRSDIQAVADVLSARFPPFSPRIGLDFGSGLGRLSFPMAQRCERVYGLDLSSAMRAEATSQAGLRGVGNVEFLPALPPDVTVDWINTYIVMQHILPRTGYGLLQGLLARLNLGGHVSIQLTYAHDRRAINDLFRDISSWRFDGDTMTVLQEQDYETGHMSMYDYDLNRVLRIFASSGITELHLSSTDHGGAHGFWFYGRKVA